MRIFVTDCEGPLTRNDNAQEIAEAFLPAGADFFARLSKYDDFLIDVARKPGYNAGNTLSLIAPFFRAFGLDDHTVEDFSRKNVLVVPGAVDLLHQVRNLMPTFVISTSYSPYIRALCAVTGFDYANCRCTELHLDDWRLPPTEAMWLRGWTTRIAQRAVITIPPGAVASAEASAARTGGDPVPDRTAPLSTPAWALDLLSPADQETVREFDRLFWHELPLRAVSSAMVGAVVPIGGGMKLAALEQIMRDTGCAGNEVMYVGDSITDTPPLAAVRDWGGVSLSFNGNDYALAAAEIAAAGGDTSPTLELAKAFASGGADAARALARAWPQPAASGGLPAVGLTAERREELAQASRAARASVRGERIADLG